MLNRVANRLARRVSLSHRQRGILAAITMVVVYIGLATAENAYSSSPPPGSSAPAGQSSNQDRPQWQRILIGICPVH